MIINSLSIKLTRCYYSLVFLDASSCFWWTGSNCHFSLLDSSYYRRLFRNRSHHPNIWASMRLPDHSHRGISSLWLFHCIDDKSHLWWNWSIGHHCCETYLYDGNRSYNQNSPSTNKWDRYICCALACRYFHFQSAFVIKGELLLILVDQKYRLTISTLSCLLIP